MFPKMTLQIREDRFSIPLGKHWMCLHKLLVSIRSVLLKHISKSSLLNCALVHGTQNAQDGFLLDETKVEYTWKGHLMHPNNTP